jgi:hypothetical protein
VTPTLSVVVSFRNATEIDLGAVNAFLAIALKAGAVIEMSKKESALAMLINFLFLSTLKAPTQRFHSFQVPIPGSLEGWIFFAPNKQRVNYIEKSISSTSANIHKKFMLPGILRWEMPHRLKVFF